MASAYAKRAKQINSRAAPGSGHINEEDVACVLATWGEECFYCLTPLTFGIDGNGSFDHLIPYHFGGKNTMHNLVPCCLRCNRMKNSKQVFWDSQKKRIVFAHERPAKEGW